MPKNPKRFNNPMWLIAICLGIAFLSSFANAMSVAPAQAYTLTHLNQFGAGLAVSNNGTVYATGTGGSFIFNPPLSVSPSNVVSISQASAYTNGYLTSADWMTFNSKLSSQTYGVNSLNNLLGTVNIISSDSNILISTSGQNIILTANIAGLQGTNYIFNPPLFNTANVISLIFGTGLGLNGAGYLVNTEPIYTAGNGISISPLNVISTLPLNGISPIVILNSNTISCPTCLISQTYGVNVINNLLGAVNVIAGANIVVSISGQNIIITANTQATGSNFNAIYFPYNTLTAGTGIILTTPNTITATGYNSAYWTGTNFNAIYFPHNTLTGTTPIVVSGNIISCSTCLTSQTYGVNSLNNLLGAVNVIGENNIYTRVSDQNVVIGIPQSSATANGFLSSIDWNTFNGKLSSQIFGVNTLNNLLGAVNIISANTNIIVLTSGQNVILTDNSLYGGITGIYSLLKYPPTSENVTFKLSNGQSTATGSNFQQMIYFNPTNSLFKNKLSQDLGNIRFYSGTNELYSWCESGCNTITSTNAIFWVKVPNIAANSNILVNATFTSADYDGVYAGEAPQLSSSYGLHDNGGNVFASYWNFNGVSLPSAWGTPSGTYAVVNNGLTITGNNANEGINSISTYNIQTYTLDTDEKPSGLIVGGRDAQTGYSTTSGTGALSGTNPWTGTGEQGSNPNWCGIVLDPADTFYGCANMGAVSTSSYQVLSQYQSATTEYASENYGSWQSSTAEYFTATSAYLTQVVYSTGVSDQIQWTRLRLTPPSGIMPTQTQTTTAYNCTQSFTSGILTATTC